VADECAATSSSTLTFTGSAPATAVATSEIPCGGWTQLCAKDEPHTKWDTTGLTVVGAKYVAAATLVLDGGDTDDDGDVDINDVTLFLSQFGQLAHAGGCPWDGTTKDADFETARAAADASPDDVVAQTLVADLDMLAGRVEDAFDRLVDVVRRTEGDDRNQAREHLLGLFAAVGNDDPRVLKGRQALANALF